MEPDVACPRCGNDLRRSSLTGTCDACDARFELGMVGRQGPVPYPYIDPKRCRMCNKELTGRQLKWCGSGCNAEFGRSCGWYVRIDGYYQNKAKHDGTLTCEKCGKTKFGWEEYDIDHVIPVALGGSHGPENLQLLCRECHRKKTASQIGLTRAGPGQTTLTSYQKKGKGRNKNGK